MFSKLFCPTVRKSCFSDREELLKFEAEGQEFCKIFDITRTIYLNCDRSEQFLNAFLTCSWTSDLIHTLEQL